MHVAYVLGSLNELPSLHYSYDTFSLCGQGYALNIIAQFHPYDSVTVHK